MSDELLRHLARNSGKLRKTKHFDPVLGKDRERLEGGTWLCLLQVLCYHANQSERQVWCGIAKLAKEAGCNTDTTYRYLELFEHLGWITLRPPRRAEAHHKPAKCWEVTLPELEPLDRWQEQLEQQTQTWEENSRVRTPVHTPVHTPQKSGNGAAEGVNDSAEGEHKQKHKPSRARRKHLRALAYFGDEEKSSRARGVEEKSLLEETLEIYAECAASKAVNSIANPSAWKAKLIGNAYKVKPQGSDLTFAARAQRALDFGKRPRDIGRWLADGCPANGSMNFWENRPDYTEQPSQEAVSAPETGQPDIEVREIEHQLERKFRGQEMSG